MPDVAALDTRPRRTTFQPFAPPLIGPEEKAELLDTLDSGWITTGPKTERFQEQVAQYVGVRCAVAVSSCTAALHLAMVAHDIGEGDEVILPTYTFASTAHVVMYQRARPVFVDSEAQTFNIDPTRLGAAVTPRTKALVIVHYAGHPCDLDAIYAIAKRHRLAVIEDAAHAIGSEYHGRKIGSFGPVTCFSFYATKNLTTGEGGMAMLNDPEMAERMRRLSMYGISDARRIWGRYAPRGSWFYDIQELGYKYNMMDIQAALGLHQLAKLEQFLQRRARFAAMYTEAFADLEEIVRPQAKPEVRSAWHLYSILLQPKRLRISRDQFIEELRTEQIGTSVLFRPLHLHSYYQKALGYPPGSFPVAESLFERTVSLPISPKMSEEDVWDVIAAVRRLVAKYRA
ncbi:MAG: DegT/DnrJ/EryC1/StrS family aminotransferase [Candidatus Omnitrophica bacterium]|nr:DegT/DnrJ/EryC1/StrS family aminotransferase [Candidatus Omnitrophota bacterium]